MNDPENYNKIVGIVNQVKEQTNKTEYLAVKKNLSDVEADRISNLYKKYAETYAKQDPDEGTKAREAVETLCDLLSTGIDNPELQEERRKFVHALQEEGETVTPHYSQRTMRELADLLETYLGVKLPGLETDRQRHYRGLETYCEARSSIGCGTVVVVRSSKETGNNHWIDLQIQKIQEQRDRNGTLGFLSIVPEGFVQLLQDTGNRFCVETVDPQLLKEEPVFRDTVLKLYAETDLDFASCLAMARKI